MSQNNWIDEPLYLKIKEKMPISCVDLLIVHDGKLLLMLRNNEPGKDLWFTPGGRIYKNEVLRDAIKRVLKKETGLESTNITQTGTMCHIWPMVHTVTTYYTMKVDSNQIQLNSEHRDYRWIEEIEKDLHPYLIEMITNSNIFPKS